MPYRQSFQNDLILHALRIQAPHVPVRRDRFIWSPPVQHLVANIAMLEFHDHCLGGAVVRDSRGCLVLTVLARLDRSSSLNELGGIIHRTISATDNAGGRLSRIEGSHPSFQAFSDPEDYIPLDLLHVRRTIISGRPLTNFRRVSPAINAAAIAFVCCSSPGLYGDMRQLRLPVRRALMQDSLQLPHFSDAQENLMRVHSTSDDQASVQRPRYRTFMPNDELTDSLD